jgi:glycosyltransferase involved in cell wall biosynthesis
MNRDKPKILVAQLGARKHYQEPVIFYNWQVLDGLYTDIYSGHSKFLHILRNPLIYKITPKIVNKFLDRFDAELKGARIIQFPLFAYLYLYKLSNILPQYSSKIFIWAGQEFCKKIINYGLGNANTIYGFNSSCLELFEYAKKRGMRCILDQTLAERSLVNKLLLEEEKQWQGWSLSPFTESEFDLKLLEREKQEQKLADQIVCGSEFVKASLIAEGVQADKITVIALGRLKNNFFRRVIERRIPQERGDGLRILFVGAVGLRKGIPYLFKALRQINGLIPFTCKIVGSLEIKSKFIAEYKDVCEFMGQIPRSQMEVIYRWADVFVLPSICEGSAMATYEALKWGLPIITTPNSGSIVRDGIDGYLVPIRSSEPLANKLINIYESLSDLLIYNNSKHNYFHKVMQLNRYKLFELIHDQYNTLN